jgi:hypothetical protein
MTKKIERTSTIAEPRKIRKLMIKKNTLKDLSAPARGQQVKGGAYRYTETCPGLTS